ncbi:MAG: transporter substrate-binding domain-containing protein [Desulfococcaceae bacterium]
MKKIQLIVFILLGTVIPGICSENSESRAQGRNPVFAQFREISVACPIAAPPYSYKDEDGLVKGYVIDIWRMWSEKTGIKISFMPESWQAGIDMVCYGKADAFAVNVCLEDQKSCLDDVTPVGRDSGYFFWRKNISGLKGIEDLKGFRIGVAKGSAEESYLRKHLPAAVLEVFPNNHDMFDAIKKREIPVFLNTLQDTLRLLKQYGLETDFQFDPQNPLYTVTGYAAVKKGDTALAEALKQGMDLITADERAAIERKWLNKSFVKTEDTLMISFPVGFSPFMFLNAEGSPSGMFADIWRLWAQKTGNKIEFLPADTWKTGIEYLKNGRADIHAGLFFAPEQYEGIGFSQPFYESGVSIFFSLTYGKISQIAELSGQSIGVVRGTSQELYLKKYHPEIRVSEFGTRDEMIYAARDGKTKGFISITGLALSDLSRLGLSGEFESLPQVLYTGKFCAGVLKQNTELMSLVNKGFDAISDKEFAEIENRWIPDPKNRYFKPDKKNIRLTVKEESWLRQHKTVRFGFVEGAEPVSYYENNEYKGLHTDYLRLISERTGIRFEYVSVIQAEFDLRAKAYEFDMFPSFNVPQRKSYSDFTNPIMEMTSVIITRSDEQFISSISVLKGKKIAVLKGFGLNKPLFDKHPEIRLIQKETMLEALKEVSDFKADAAILPTISACWLIQKHRLVNLRIAGIADHPPEPYMYGIRKEYPELLSIINKGIDSITKEEHEAILQKWFTVKVEHKADWSEIWHWFLGISGFFTGILLISLLWNRRLTREIDERRRAEETLKSSEEKFRAIFENSSSATAIMEPDTTISMANSEFCRIVGYSIDEIIGTSWTRFIPPDDLERLKEYNRLRIINPKDAPEKYDFMFYNRNGELRHAFMSLAIISGINQKIASFIDITDRKQAEEYLKRNEARLESLLRISQYKTGNINELLDYALDEAIALTGSRIGYIYYYSEERREFTLNSWSKDVIKECRITKPYTLYHLDRTGVWGEAVRQRKSIIINDFQSPHPLKKGYPEGHAALHRFMTVPIIIEDKIQAVVGVANKASYYDDSDARQLILMMDSVWNIAERRKGEEELKKAKADAEAANKAKSAFLAGMSHELRTPLNGILGYAQILKDDPSLSEDHGKGLTIIEKSGNHLLSLLNDILELAKVESGKIELTESVFHFPDMIRTVNSMIEVRAERKGISYCYEEISSEEKGKMPVYLHGDEKHLIQVLVNLLGNAVKFTEKGSITLKTENRGTEPGNGFVLRVLGFEIRDTGIGMTEQDLGKLFRPFQQVGDKKFHAGGTGLGLVISKTLVELMGGKLDVSSQYGSGTVFSFELKLRDAEEKKENQFGNIRKILGYKGKKHRILIADDKEFNRHVFSDLLSPLGFEISDAENGEDGLEKAREFPPDLIVTDLMMPGMDGIEFIRNIRQSPELRHIPVIASSASVYAQDRQNSLAAGADEFLEKPMDIGIFMEQLQRLLHLEWDYEEKLSGDIATDCLPSEEVLENIYVLATMGGYRRTEQCADSAGRFGTLIRSIYGKNEKTGCGI